MNVKARIFFSLAVISLVLLLSACGCKPPNPKKYSLKLSVWGFLDDRDALIPIFENYKKLNPNVTSIEYKKLTKDTYQKEVIDALASGQGPDIFLINNNWLPQFKDKVAPAPSEVIVQQKVKNDFVDTVETDFVTSDGQIWALPLTVDSLALYYNRDLFNEAGITSPPKDWNEFTDDVRRLTKIDNFGEIRQSGVAMGTAGNINRASDILSLLILQSGNEIVDRKDGRVTLADTTAMADGSGQASPGEGALAFYTQFARTGSANYAWNPRLHYSIDAFSEGTAAMMFNYSWQMPVVRAKAPKLNFSVAPIPQFAGSRPVNYPNYFGYVVARNKIPETDVANGGTVSISNDQRLMEAWKLITFLTTRPESSIEIKSNVAGTQKVTNSNYDPALEYVKAMNVPAARRDIIEYQKSIPDLSPFSYGNLIAKSWYQKSPDVVEGTFLEIIDNVNRGQMTIKEAISMAAARIIQTMVN